MSLTPAQANASRAQQAAREEDPPGQFVVIDLTDEVALRAAMAHFIHGNRLPLDDFVDVLREAGIPVEQAEDEAAGYTDPGTGAFIGNRRPRWVGPWEEA